MKNKIIKFILLSLMLVGCSVNGNSTSSSGIKESSKQSTSQVSSESSSTKDEVTSSSSSNSSGTTSSSKPSTSSSNTELPPIEHIKVFVETSYTHVYAWLNTNSGAQELCGKWPGTKMQDYNKKWRTFEFPEHQSLNIIFNKNGSPQTADLVISEPGYYWWYNDQFHTSEPEFEVDDTPLGGVVVEGNIQDKKQPVFGDVKAKSWEDFSLWDELPEDHWKTINKYEGERTDFRNESIYFTITTRFYDGDSSNNTQCWDGSNPKNDPAWRGDFKGLIEKMDYIKALGFTAIWITPVVENCSGYDYHGYHALNFQKVDPRYLSEDVDFQDVIDEAHARNMKIILDVVFNHTGNFGESNLFPMFEKYGELASYDCVVKYPSAPLPSNYENLTGADQYAARINSMKNIKNDGSDPNYIYHHYGNFSWESFGEQVAQIAGDCVDLNTENPVVAEYIVRSYGEFIRMGVDAFRIDTMKHISRLTLNNYIFPALYEYADRCGNENFFMFGEVCTRVREVWNRNIPALSAPFYTWKEEKQYAWGDTETNLASIEQAYNDNSSVSGERTSSNAKLNGMEYHTPDYSQSNGVGVIDFPMHWNFQYARDSFNLAKNTDQYYNDATYNVVYVDSHDYGPDCISTVRYNMGTQAWSENMALMFTFRGIPCIYYGSEIEFQKGVQIDVGPNAPLSQTGRAYFGDHLEGEINVTDFGEFTASGKVSETLNSPLAQNLIKLNKIRQAVPALSLGQYTTTGVTGEMAFIRRYTDDSIDSIALCTISGGATFTSVPNGRYIDVITGDIQNVSNGVLKVPSIGKGNLRVYVKQTSGINGRIGNSTAYYK